MIHISHLFHGFYRNVTRICGKTQPSARTMRRERTEIFLVISVHCVTFCRNKYGKTQKFTARRIVKHTVKFRFGFQNVCKIKPQCGYVAAERKIFIDFRNIHFQTASEEHCASIINAFIRSRNSANHFSSLGYFVRPLTPSFSKSF